MKINERQPKSMKGNANQWKALKSMDGGKTLEILSTDPGSVADFAAFCRTTGNELVDQNEEGGVWTYLIRKSG